MKKILFILFMGLSSITSLVANNKNVQLASPPGCVIKYDGTLPVECGKEVTYYPSNVHWFLDPTATDLEVFNCTANHQDLILIEGGKFVSFDPATGAITVIWNCDECGNPNSKHRIYTDPFSVPSIQCDNIIRVEIDSEFKVVCKENCTAKLNCIEGSWCFDVTGDSCKFCVSFDATQGRMTLHFINIEISGDRCIDKSEAAGKTTRGGNQSLINDLSGPLSCHNFDYWSVSNLVINEGACERYKQSHLNTTNTITEFSVYPNPAQDFMNVIYTINETGSLLVTNQLGQAVYSTELNKDNNMQTINTDSFSNGIYFITLKNSLGKVIETKKIAVQK